MNSADQNRKKLDDIFEKGNFEDIKFFVSPGTEAVVDECVSSVSKTLQKLTEGTLKEYSPESSD